MNVSVTGRGFVGTSIATICEFLKSLTSGQTKDGRILSADHSAKLDKARAHLQQAHDLMDEVISAHEGNLATRTTPEEQPVAVEAKRTKLAFDFLLPSELRSNR